MGKQLSKWFDPPEDRCEIVMDYTATIATDTASIALFDPLAAADFPDDWCGMPAHEIPHVSRGDVAFISLGSDGVYGVRVTDGDLSADECAYAAGVITDLGLKVMGGEVFLSGGEVLPWTPEQRERSATAWLTLAPRRYHVEAYWVHWSGSPRWWREDGSVPDAAPADFIFKIAAASQPRLGPRESRLDMVDPRWVYPELARETGPVPGMVLVTTVRKAPSGLTLKPCGPCFYQAELVDYAPVQWRDQVRIRVDTVDHSARRFLATFVETLTTP